MRLVVSCVNSGGFDVGKRLSAFMCGLFLNSKPWRNVNLEFFPPSDKSQIKVNNLWANFGKLTCRIGRLQSFLKSIY